jgi:hypothetical protein
MENQNLAVELFDAVRGYVAQQFDALASRIKDLEAREPVAGKDGAPGKDGEPGRDGINGKDGAPGLNGKDGSDGINGKDGAQGLCGKDGAPGADGKPGESVSLELVAALVSGEVAKQFANIKVKDGADGKDGKDGRDGKDVDMAHVKEMVRLSAEAMPKPENGKDGRDGKDADVSAITDSVFARVKELIPVVKDGRDGLNGKDADEEAIALRVKAMIPTPKDGQDGIDGKSAAEVDVEKLALDVLSRIPTPRDGRDGPKGKQGDPGNDGFSPENFELRSVGRNIIVSMKCGDRVIEKTCRGNWPIWQGVYDPNRAYEKDDEVTYGGSVHIAVRDASPGEKPASDGSPWKLCVKKG